MKNIHFFLSPIKNETRLYKETDSLLKFGIFHEILVIGVWEHELPINEIHANGVKIYRAQTTIKKLIAKGRLNKPGLIRSFLALYGFIEYGWKALLAAIKFKPNFISCHNLVLLPIGVIAAFITKANLIYVPHELETERTGLEGTSKRVSKWIERFFIYRCYKVVVVCEPIARWYKMKYNLRNIYVLRNVPYQFANVVNHSAEKDFRRIFSISADAIIFIYQGVLGKERGTEELLNIFSGLTSNKHIVFMGYGESKELIKQFSVRYSNIHFHPAVPMNEIIEYTRSADMGIFVVNQKQLSLSYAYCLPNKFFEYIMGDLPLMVSSNMIYLSDLILENKLGWVVNADSIKIGIEQVSKDQIDNLKSYILPYAKKIGWQHEAKILYDIYNLNNSDNDLK